MHATILFAHGSRDPLWKIPMENVASRMLGLDPSTQVRCAFLELTQPDLATATAELVSTGATSITIVPMFLGVGKHAREDMPLLVNDLRDTHPEIVFRLKLSVGEEPQVIELLAQMAMPSP